MLIRPSSKADEALIIREWPTVQRIMVSLAQRTLPKRPLSVKLSSYARQNQTQKALWELDNICRTMYILDFIDDADLRQGVQAALNRGERSSSASPISGLRQWWQIQGENGGGTAGVE